MHDHTTYHPAPVMIFTPISGGSDHAMVSRLMDEWIEDSWRTIIGDWELTLWSVDAGAFCWFTVEDLTCAAPNHVPRSFELVPSIPWATRRPEHTAEYRGVRSYTNVLQKLDQDTWYLSEYSTVPSAWLADARWLPEVGLTVAAIVEHGANEIRGWAAVPKNLWDGKDAAFAATHLIMAAIDDAIGDRALPDLLVVPDRWRHLDRSVQAAVQDRLSVDASVIPLQRFHAAGAVASMNFGFRKLANCGRTFIVNHRECTD